jgi:hypothetical protein
VAGYPADDYYGSPSAAPNPVTPVGSAPASTHRQSPQVTNRRRVKLTNPHDLPIDHLNRLVPGVRFERKKYGFDLCWNPTGQRGRSNNPYFARIGKRLLAEVGTGPDSEERIRQIVQEKLREKGIASPP